MSLPPTRPPLRYHGGKWKLAPWIIGFFPGHQTYVEPFGGGASVLLRKEPSHLEVYNDLDGEVVNLFRVLRSPLLTQELVRLLELTPFSRDEFESSFVFTTDPLEQARRTVTRAAMTFHGYKPASIGPRGSGFRVVANCRGAHPAQDWARLPTVLPQITKRLKGVVIENRCALEVIQQHDSPQTLLYVDPPYHPSVRTRQWKTRAYAHEMTPEEHENLATLLHGVQGSVIVSHYSCELYDDLYKGWRKESKEVATNGSSKIECLYISPNARSIQAALPFEGGPS